MDQLPTGKATSDAATDHIMLVSLGCFCGPKLSFKNIGRGAETLPFDWMRTRHKGLVHFLENDWDESSNYNDFFEFTTKKVVPGCNMTTYRSFYHSFWHDDPTDPGMLSRYIRRIKRFNEIDADSKPVLFVRTIPTTDELKDVPELLELLIKRHGKQAYLLLIVDFQNTAQGAALVDGVSNLMVHYLGGSAHVDKEGLPAPPYGGPVKLAMDWIAGRQVSAMHFVSMEKIIECADPTEWGLNGLGGLYAFEQSLEPADEESPSLPKMSQLPALSSGELVKHFKAKASAEKSLEGATLIALGCSGLTKASILSMGLPSPDLPFDWLCISDAGLLHFLRKGFMAPIREGLGAGTQRPLEKRGFYDFATRKKVQGTSLMMCRSHVHSFWHDDPGSLEVRESFDRQIDHFEGLGLSGSEVLLFVRAIATEAELLRLGELMSALSKKFGQQVALLVICDFQSGVQGPHFVEGYEDLMVYYLEAGAHDSPVPYKQPIEVALDWVNGADLSAAFAPDFKALHSLATPTSWGLAGMAGLHAFEGALQSVEVEGRDTPAGPEDQWLMDAKFEADKDALALVSLGYHEFLGRALEMAKLNVEDSPFEGAFVRLSGVLHFLRNDFEDFFELSEPKQVPGTTFSVSRSGYHSVWEQDGENRRQASKEKIKSFRQLAQNQRAKVFLRAAASPDELSMLGELYSELSRCFQGHVMLLVMLGGQPENRTVTIEGQYNIMVQFLKEDKSNPGGVQNYIAPVKQSLDWAVGRDFKVGIVSDFEALQSLASLGSSDTIYGPGNLPIFEDLVSTTDDSEKSSSNSSSPGPKDGYCHEQPPLA